MPMTATVKSVRRPSNGITDPMVELHTKVDALIETMTAIQSRQRQMAQRLERFYRAVLAVSPDQAIAVPEDKDEEA